MPDDQTPQTLDGKGRVPVHATATIKTTATITANALTYRQGFADLFDIAAPPAKLPPAPAASPTAEGFARTGEALRQAMSAFRGRTGK
jgi:hypothetical protein